MAILRADVIRKYLIKCYNAGNNLRKQWYVEFHATDAITGKRVRKKITVSTKLHSVPERTREMLLIEQEVIDMLIAQNGFINVAQTKQTPALKFTVTEAANEGLRILRLNVSDASALTYATAVNSFSAWLQVARLADKPLTAFTNADAKKYLLWLKERGVNNMTHNSYKQLLHAVFKYFNELHNYGANVFDNIKGKKVEHSANLPYNEEQKKIILQWLRAHNHGLYCLATFLYYLTPRIGELMRMRVYHLQQMQGFSLISGSSSKTDNTRRPELGIHFLDFLNNETNILQQPGNWFIFSADNFLPGADASNANNANKRYKHCVKQMIKDCGLYVMPRQNLYSWKSTGGYDLYQRTKDIQAVKTQMGHTNEATTWRYLKQKGAVDENVRAVIREMQPKIM